MDEAIEVAPPVKSDSRGSAVAEFGNTATKLSSNPLGIIALFIVLVYGFASLVVGFGGSMETRERFPLIVFLAVFPVLVLVLFGWLVGNHHEKLYGPKDYAREENFLQALHRKFEAVLPVAAQTHREPDSSGILSGLKFSTRKEEHIQAPHTGAEAEIPGPQAPRNDEATEHDESRMNLKIYRKMLNEKQRHIALVHAIKPSTKPGQVFDVSIYLREHGNGGQMAHVSHADFYFGGSWGDRIFRGVPEGGPIGVRTSAYGPFLCVCAVHFDDGSRVLLNRYIDFEMGEVLTKLLTGA